MKHQPMEDQPKKRASRILRNRTLLLFVPTALALALIGLSAHIDAEWERMKATGLKLEERVRAELAGPRPTVHADPIEGNAWADYETAFALVPSNSSTAWLSYIETVRAGKRDEGQRAALLDGHAASIEALLRGARHTDGAAPLRWEDGYHYRSPKLKRTRDLANVVSVAAREQAEMGQPGQAVDLLLAVVQLGGDLQRSPLMISAMIGVALVGNARSGLIEPPGPGSESVLALLPREELERISDALVMIEEGLPNDRLFVDGELALLVREFERGGGQKLSDLESGGIAWKEWQHLFSSRLLWADVVRDRAEWSAVHLANSANSWEVRRAAMREERRAAEESANSLSTWFGGADETVLRSYLLGILNLRMARMVVDHRLGRMRILADPFGGELQVVEDGETLSIVSCGSDESEVLPAYQVELPLDFDLSVEGG